MLIRFHCTVAGPEVHYGAGAIVDLPGPQAQKFINAGYANKYNAKETAVNEFREVAIEDQLRILRYVQKDNRCNE